MAAASLSDLIRMLNLPNGCTRAVLVLEVSKAPVLHVTRYVSREALNSGDLRKISESFDLVPRRDPPSAGP